MFKHSFRHNLKILSDIKILTSNFGLHNIASNGASFCWDWPKIERADRFFSR